MNLLLSSSNSKEVAVLKQAGFLHVSLLKSIVGTFLVVFHVANIVTIQCCNPLIVVQENGLWFLTSGCGLPKVGRVLASKLDVAKNVYRKQLTRL